MMPARAPREALSGVMPGFWTWGRTGDAWDAAPCAASAWAMACSAARRSASSAARSSSSYRACAS